MNYPGNETLAEEIRERILNTFRQTLELAEKGDHREAELGCDFVLRLDPLFEPARKLRERLQAESGLIKVTDLKVSVGDAVFADSGRLWLLYASRPGLPDTAAPGIGAIVTEFPFATSPGLTKELVGGASGADFIEVAGEIGAWIEGPHELILPDLDGSAVQGRSAGNTLLWERGRLTIRLEVALPLNDALRIAVSFE